jgi:hypothetical protein
MSQFLVLSNPRHTEHASAFGIRYRTTLDEFLIESGRTLLGGEDIFVCDSPRGVPFEAWFDSKDFSRAVLDEVIDDCVDNFASLALFYGGLDEVERASDLADLKHIVDRQWNRACLGPIELYATWIERA